MTPQDADPSPDDDAARAGWLYYVAGMTQDQIAQELGVGRQRAQRLVSRAMADGVRAIAPAAATELERFLRIPDPLVIAFGTGRALRAMAEEFTPPRPAITASSRFWAPSAPTGRPRFMT